MGAELSNHLGYEKHEMAGRGSGNNWNGKSCKTVQGDFGAVQIEVPRDRNGGFEPKTLPKHERRFHSFDGKILSLRNTWMGISPCLNIRLRFGVRFMRQHRGVATHHAAQGDPNTRLISERKGGLETALSGAEERAE